MISKAVLVARNFLIANLFVFVPLLLAATWTVSDRLSVTIESDEAVEVRAGMGNVLRVGCCGGSSRTVVMHFADGCDEDHLRIEFSPDNCKMKLVEVALTRRLFFRRVLISRQPLKWSGYRLSLAPFWLKIFASAEVAMLLAACFGLVLKRDDTVLARYVQPAVVALHAALFVGVIIPVGTWLGNRDFFCFPIDRLLADCVPLAFGIALVCFACLFASRFAFDRLVMAMMVALLSYGYLLSGILSARVPLLDGDFEVMWRSSSYMPDYLALVSVFALFAVLYHWLKRHLHLVSLAVLALSALSLADIAIAKKTEASKMPLASHSLADVVRSLKYSRVRNVICLVVDSVRADVAERIVRENAELCKEFDGFIAFDNNLGMHPSSQFGVPGLLTGRYYEPGADTIEYLDEQRGEESYVTAYEKAGAAVYFGTDTSNHRYTNRYTEPKSGFGARTDGSAQANEYGGKSVFRLRTRGMPNVSLLDVVRLRLVPMQFKAYFLMRMLYGAAEEQTDLEREKNLYPRLAEAPVSDEPKLTLVHFHTVGAHPVHVYDRNGNYVTTRRDPAVAEYEQTYYVLDQLARLLRSYRDRGLYDSSLVLVAADHGNRAAEKDGENGAARPMLWVKPFGAAGELVHSLAATSHDKIRDFLVESIDRDLTKDECVAALTSPSRKYVDVSPDGSLSVDP